VPDGVLHVRRERNAGALTGGWRVPRSARDRGAFVRRIDAL
jgi:hypothetical protein